MPFDGCGAVKRQDSRAFSDDLYHRVDTVYVEPYRFECHAKLLAESVLVLRAGTMIRPLRLSGWMVLSVCQDVACARSRSPGAPLSRADVGLPYRYNCLQRRIGLWMCSTSHQGAWASPSASERSSAVRPMSVQLPATR